MATLDQNAPVDYREDDMLQDLSTPPGIRRALSDFSVVQNTAMPAGDGPLPEHGHHVAQQDQLDDSTLTPEHLQPRLLGIKNPKLAGLASGVSPYTPVDLNVYLRADHATPTPNRTSPSHHLLPPLSASSSRSHSPATSNQSLSPLPTLSELRNLQRANSAAGRLMAMKKLMGQTPPSPTSLRRAGSLNVGAQSQMMLRRRGSGGNQNGDEDDDDEDEDGQGGDTVEQVDSDDDGTERNAKDDEQLAHELNSFGAGMLGSPTKQTGARRNPNRSRRLGSIDLLRNHRTEQYPLAPEDQPDLDIALGSSLGSAREVAGPSAFPRPRLGRSNTVGTGGGEERRSVIGRRMMERLGSRTRVAEGDATSSPGPAGLQALMQRAKERRENEARTRQAEIDAQQLEVQEAVPAYEEDSMAAESHRNDPSGSPPSLSPIPLTHSYDREEGDESGSEAVEPFSQASAGPPIVLSDPVAPSSPPRAKPHNVLVRDSSEDAGRSSFDAAVSSESDHQHRGSVMFAETSGSEDSHQRYRQHSPYFGLGHPGFSGAQGQSLFAGSSDLARSVSQATARSGMSDKFEYEAHLRRSGSEKRTTRASMVTPTPGDVVGNVTMEEILDADDSALREDTIEEIQSPIDDRDRDGDLPPNMPNNHKSQEEEYRPLSAHAAHEFADGPEDLLPPLAPFVNENGTPLRDSTANQSGGKHSTTPSESSLGSSLSAIPFIVSTGAEGSPETRAPRMPIPRRDMSMSSFPAEVQDGDRRVSDFGTPGRHYGSSANSPSGTLTASKDSPGSSSIGLVTPRILDSQPSPENFNDRTHRRLGSAFEERQNDYRDHEIEELDDTASPAKYSIMSWHDVDVPANSPIPSEQYTKRSQGVVQALKSTFMRNRSRSNSRTALDQALTPTVTPGTPTRTSHGSLASVQAKEALNTPPHRESRRGSQRSDASSVITGPHASMQSSVFSTAPSVVLPAGQVSPLPQIDPNDPRALNSKLSPFVPQSMHAPLLQQASDSVVPTMTSSKGSPPLSHASSRTSHSQLDTSPSSAQASYYDLTAAKELTPHDEKSIGKKSWLADTFFPPHGATTKRRPSISNLLRRKGSMSQNSSRKNSVTQDAVETVLPASTPPTAARVPPPLEAADPSLASPLSFPVMSQSPGAIERMVPISPPLKLSAAPSTLSAVEEQMTPISPTPQGYIRGPAKESNRASNHELAHADRAARTESLLSRLDSLLSSDPKHRLAVFDDPPRRLVASAEALQVVNNHTILDRHLFLFSDILVVAEPIPTNDLEAGATATFAIKSIVPLQTSVSRHVQRKTTSRILSSGSDIAEFRAHFAYSPDRAVDRLSEQTRIAQDSSALAEILFDSHDFDKSQLADYLVQPRNRTLLDEFIRQFNFGGIRIDRALRVYIMALRLPSDNVGFESILQAFAKGWYQANISTIKYGLNTVRNLVLLIMKLHDGYHQESTFGFARAESVVTCGDFIAGFYKQDGQRVVEEGLLKTLYDAVRNEKYVQAGSAEEIRQRGRRAEITPSSEETWLAAGEWSEPFVVTIPSTDSGLTIRLLGEGLAFDRDVLEFGSFRRQSFRVKGSVPGRFKLLLSRSGENAALYPSLPNGITIALEPLFRFHSFDLSFLNSLGHRRRCRFSLPDKASVTDFVKAIEAQTVETKTIKGRGAVGWAQQSLPHCGTLSPTFLQAADRMSLRALSDALLYPLPHASEAEIENDLEATPKAHKPLGSWTISSAQETYNAAEAERFGRPINQVHGTPTKKSRSDKGQTRGTKASVTHPLTGTEVELVCRQNSLIPVILGLLEIERMVSNGIPQTNHEHKAVGS